MLPDLKVHLTVQPHCMVMESMYVYTCMVMSTIRSLRLVGVEVQDAVAGRWLMVLSFLRLWPKSIAWIDPVNLSSS